MPSVGIEPTTLESNTLTTRPRSLPHRRPYTMGKARGKEEELSDDETAQEEENWSIRDGDALEKK